MEDGKNQSIEKSNDIIGNRTRELKACSIVSTNYATASHGQLCVMHFKISETDTHVLFQGTIREFQQNDPEKRNDVKVRDAMFKYITLCP
jgi:hypothetical protein